MPSPNDDADAIREQMARIRSEMHRNVQDVVQVAAIATDWRSYVRARPWLAIGVAFAAGYMIVPKRRKPQPIRVVAEAVEPVVREVTPPRKKRRFGTVRWVLGAIAPLALQAAQSYAAQYLENYLANLAPGTGPAPGPPKRPRPGDDAPADPTTWKMAR